MIDFCGVIKYIWKPADSRHFQAGRSGRGIAGIILHSTCGKLHGDIETLTVGEREVSSHWYVTRTGEVYHFVQNADTAYHVGAVVDQFWSNSRTLGIEQEHLDGLEDWPDIQVQTTAALCVALGPYLIRHHSQVCAPPGRKVDPVAFPSIVFWKAYDAAVQVKRGAGWTFAEVPA